MKTVWKKKCVYYEVELALFDLSYKSLLYYSTIYKDSNFLGLPYNQLKYIPPSIVNNLFFYYIN